MTTSNKLKFINQEKDYPQHKQQQPTGLYKEPCLMEATWLLVMSMLW